MNDPPVTATHLIWQGAGCPESGLALEPTSGHCAACGAPLTEAAPVEQVSAKSAFSQHADFVQGSHFCPACAWLFNIGRGRPGNVIAFAGETLSPMISVESALAEGRPSWLSVLRSLAALPAGSPVAGILTTDFKPRLFPRMRLGAAPNVTLYVHSPDHDQSGNLTFNAADAVVAAELISECLALGFTKARCHFGLLTDFERVKKLGPQRAVALENGLDAHRLEAHWLPALLAAHKPLKEAENERKHNPERTEQRDAGRHPARSDAPRLF